MYYSELVKKACNIMFDAHKEDMDKGGYPYVFHPFYLATQMDDEMTTCVALLHDVIEDHWDKYSYEDLKNEGFPEEVLEAVKLLTHDDETPYMDYVNRIGHNPIARKVKLADLKHNMDVRRNAGKKHWKYETYQKAVELLEGFEHR